MSSWKYLKTATLGTVTLGSSYTSGSGSMSLTAGQGARLPSSGDFWLAWSEDQSDPDAVIHLWKVTARSTDTLTVTAEASEGGGDTNVSSGETLRAVMPISALDQLRIDIHQTGAYSSAASEKQGNLYLPNNGFQLLRDSGSAMIPWGPIFPLTQPVDGDFAWINQGGSTVSATNGGIVLSVPASASRSLRIRKKAAPSTPYTITGAFLTVFGSANFANVGLLFRESSSGKLATISYQNDETFYALTYTDPNTFNSNDASFGFRLVAPCLWFRIADDGVNRIVSFSADGQTYHQLYSVARTTFLTADEVGFFGNSENSAALYMTLLGWSQA